MWHTNVKINAVFMYFGTPLAWTDIDGIGWRQIKAGAADGIVNLWMLLCIAKVKDRPVHLYIDPNDHMITTAYLI
jgi:hypothetical protein